jgi:predicted ATPase with chaperone activity
MAGDTPPTRCGSRRAAITGVLRVARTLADLDGADRVISPTGSTLGEGCVYQ